MLDRKIRYCSLPEAVRDHFLWGARLDRHRRHARQDDDDVAGRVAADARRASTRACSSAASPRTSGRRSSYRIGEGRDFVIEGDEYDSAFFDKTAKFLKYLPDIAVVNNIEFDHADIYADLDAIRLAFRRLVNLVPRRGLLLLGADSPDARGAGDARASRRSRPSACRDGADWQAHDLDGRRRVDALQRAHGAGARRHASSAAARRAQRPQRARRDRRRARRSGSRADTLAEGLRAFKGVKRRLEIVGTA